MKKKLHLLLILVMFFAGQASAQLVNYFNAQWSVKFQHSTDDFYSNEARKIVVDSSTGNIFVLADVTSNIDPNGNITSNTFSYTTIVKYDETGNFMDSYEFEVGQHTVTGFDYNSGFGLDIDNTGNLYVGYMSYNASTDYDVKISKLDTGLNLAWTYTYNNLSNDQGISMSTPVAGQVFAIVKSVSNGTTIRYRVIKASGNGTSATSLYNFNSAPDFLNSITVDASSNCYVTGYRLLSGVKSILTASVSSSGVLRWIKVDNCGTIGGNDFGNCVSIGVDGFVYITGASTGTVQHGMDVVTMKMSSTNGKKVWENFINYNLTDGGVFINVQSPNIAYVSWVAANTVFLDQIVTTTGAAGRRASYNPIPESPYTVLNGASVTDMKMSNSGNIYLTGNINANDGSQSFSAGYLLRINFATRGTSRIECESHILGSFTQGISSSSIALNNNLKSVIWAQNHSEDCSSHQQEKVNIKSMYGSGYFRTGNNLNGHPQFSTYPSPASERVFVSSENTIKEITIYNASGQILLQEYFNEFEKKQAELNIMNFSPGLYLMQILYINGTFDSTKLMIK